MQLATGKQVYLTVDLLCICRLVFELKLRNFTRNAKLAKQKLQCSLVCELLHCSIVPFTRYLQTQHKVIIALRVRTRHDMS